MDLALVMMMVVSVFMISTVEYPKFKGALVVAVGSILIVSTCLPQNILSIIAYFPAKILFVLAVTYLLAVPVMDLYANLRRSGPNVR